MSRREIKPTECERKNLLRILSLLDAAPDAAVSTWLKEYDWSHANIDSVGWFLTHASPHVRHRFLETGFFCSSIQAQWHRWAYALPSLVAHGDWGLMERVLRLAGQIFLTKETEQKLKASKKFYASFPTYLAENILNHPDRDGFVARFILSDDVVSSIFLKLSFFDFSEDKKKTYIEAFRDRTRVVAKGKADICWALEKLTVGPRNLRWMMEEVLFAIEHQDVRKDFFESWQTAIEIIDGHLSGLGGLGEEDVCYQKWSTQKRYTGSLLLHYVEIHNLWSSISSNKTEEGRDMMVKMLAWHSVPGFNSPTSQEIVESLSAGANLWTDKIAKQISKQVPIPSAKELGLLLATGQVSHLKMRLKGVPSGSETVLDGVIPFAWSKIGSHKSQKKVAEDATWVLSRLSVSRLGELLETAKEWKADDAAHVIDESDLDRALWLRVIENAWLMKSTPKTSSVQRPQRL